MSGGHFDYTQYLMEDVAVEIDNLIEEHNSMSMKEWLGCGPEDFYPREVIKKFEEAAYTIRRAAVMVQRIDYLVSCDDGEESFLKRWKDEVRNPYPSIYWN